MSRLQLTVLFLCAVWGSSQCAPLEGPCPTFWTFWGNHCYRYFGDEVSWTEAVNTCRLFSAKGGSGFADLVSIHSQEEQNFLYSYWRSLRQYDSRPRKPGMWIGLTDVEEDGVYKWSDGTPVDYTYFDVNQESNEYRWFIWDWTDSTWNPQGKWHDVIDDPSWYYQFMCKMAYE